MPSPSATLSANGRPADDEGRTDANGVQWWLDSAHHWRPVVHAPQPDADREAGQ